MVEITDYLDSLLDKTRASHPDVHYYVTGDVVMHRAFADATRDDLQTLTPVVFAIITGAAVILLRSLLGTAAIVAMLVFVIATTMGFAAGTARCSAPPTPGCLSSSWS